MENKLSNKGFFVLLTILILTSPAALRGMDRAAAGSQISGLNNNQAQRNMMGFMQNMDNAQMAEQMGDQVGKAALENKALEDLLKAQQAMNAAKAAQDAGKASQDEGGGSKGGGGGGQQQPQENPKEESAKDDKKNSDKDELTGIPKDQLVDLSNIPGLGVQPGQPVAPPAGQVPPTTTLAGY